MTLTVTPAWASSVIRNYRSFFKEKYGRETVLNDDQIFHIFNTVFDDTNNAKQDEYRVEAMLDAEVM